MSVWEFGLRELRGSVHVTWVQAAAPAVPVYKAVARIGSADFTGYFHLFRPGYQRIGGLVHAYPDQVAPYCLDPSNGLPCDPFSRVIDGMSSRFIICCSI